MGTSYNMLPTPLRYAFALRMCRTVKTKQNIMVTECCKQRKQYCNN